MKLFVPVLLAALWCSGCRPPEPPSEAKPDPSVLAIVGTTEIRRADLDAEIALRKSSRRSPTDPEPVLQEMIDRAIMVARAREIGLDRDRDVARRMENILVAELERRELRPRFSNLPAAVPTASTRELRSAPQPQLRMQSRLAVLQYSLSPRMTESRRGSLETRLKEARELAAKLPSDEPGFGALAVDYSDHQESRYQGGDRGWFDADGTSPLLPREVLTAGSALQQPGDLSPVIHTERGLFLVRLVERVRAESPVGADAALQRRQVAVRDARRQIEADYRAELRRRIGVQVSAPRPEVASEVASLVARPASPDGDTVRSIPVTPTGE